MFSLGVFAAVDTRSASSFSGKVFEVIHHAHVIVGLLYIPFFLENAQYWLVVLWKTCCEEPSPISQTEINESDSTELRRITSLGSIHIRCRSVRFAFKKKRKNQVPAVVPRHLQPVVPKKDRQLSRRWNLQCLHDFGFSQEAHSPQSSGLEKIREIDLLASLPFLENQCKFTHQPTMHCCVHLYSNFGRSNSSVFHSSLEAKKCTSSTKSAIELLASLLVIKECVCMCSSCSKAEKSKSESFRQKRILLPDLRLFAQRNIPESISVKFVGHLPNADAKKPSMIAVLLFIHLWLVMLGTFQNNDKRRTFLPVANWKVVGLNGDERLVAGCQANTPSGRYWDCLETKASV